MHFCTYKDQSELKWLAKQMQNWALLLFFVDMEPFFNLNLGSEWRYPSRENSSTFSFILWDSSNVTHDHDTACFFLESEKNQHDCYWQPMHPWTVQNLLLLVRIRKRARSLENDTVNKDETLFSLYSFLWVQHFVLTSLVSCKSFFLVAYISI